MDLSAPISYNGLTISGLTQTAGGKPSSGMVIENIDISDVDVDAYLEKRALHDGLNATDIYLGGRRVSIDAGIYGSTKAHGWDQLQAFVRAFNPRIAYNDNSGALGFANFDFRQPTTSTATWAAGYIPLRMGLRPLRPVRYSVSRAASIGGDADGVSFRANALLIAKDPRKYVQTATGPINVDAAVRTATSNGDFPTSPIFSWTMTAAGSASLTLIIDGRSTAINMSGQTSGTWTFDFSTRALSKAGTLFPQLIVSSTGFPDIQPGTTTTYTRANASGVSNGWIQMTYTDAFA